MTRRMSNAVTGLPSLPPRPSTAEHAATLLRGQITSGRLMPGTKLREEQVAASLSISRNTVREAFRLLAHERLVEHVAYRGVHIRTIGTDDIGAMFATRRLVEPLGMRAAISDPEIRRAMREAVTRATRAAADDDWLEVGTADIAFHRALVDGCHSAHLSEMFEKLLAELRLAFLQLAFPKHLHRPYIARNAGLVALAEAGDLAAAQVELADYLDSAEHDVLLVIHE